MLFRFLLILLLASSPALAQEAASKKADVPFRADAGLITAEYYLATGKYMQALDVLNNVLTPEECDELIRLSRIKLKRSTIVDPLSGEYRVIEDRSSSGTFFALNENEFISRLDRRISEVVNWPAENGEGLQILNYQIGGEYKAHFDYFPPDDPGSQPHLNNGGQRVSTLVVYLNDVDDGGETVFPRINLSVCPRKGSAVYFEYCNATGEVDPMTLHGGAPVRAGEKWIATKWMRQSRYGSN